jgi:hypothetical protein
MNPYEEMADPFETFAGPVSETRAIPSGAKLIEKAPGPTLGLITIGDRVPSACTLKTSMSLVRRSVTARKLPSGLKAIDAAPEVLVLRKESEFLM